jgi:hypothetical protein
MRLSGTKTGAINQYNGLGDQLYDLGGARPTLDLNFANNGSLVDSVTGKTLVQHTRQSNATYVDGDGVIRTATTNLLLQSEDFSTTWTNSESSENINVAVAPNGTTTADALVDTVNNSPHNISQNVAGSAGSTSYTFSCYMKKGSKDFGALIFGPNSSWETGSGASVFFDLTNGTISASTSATGTIQALPNGWYRCTATATTVASPGTVFVRIGSSLTGTAQTYNGNGDEAIYLWGAQLEQSPTVGEYIPTTSTINSAPRFDHDFTTGESLGLLVEEARTNEVRSSSMTGGATGTPGTYPTGLVTNSLASGLTLQIAALGTDAGVGYIDIRVSGTTADTNGFSISLQPSTDAVASSGQIWTGSCYCSLVAGSYLNTISPRLRILERTAVGGYLAEGSGVAITATGTSILQARATVTRTLANALTARAQLGFVVSIASGVAVDFTFRFAAPQLELGAFPTSYIPTTGAAATRAADVASISGSNFSSWYRQDEGTVFADVTVLSTAKNNQTISIDDDTTANRIELRPMGGATNIRHDMVAGGVLQHSGVIAVGSGLRRVAALGYKSADTRLQSGSTGETFLGPTVPAVNQMQLNRATFSNGELNGTIRRLTYWPTRLPNETLQNITQ